MSLAALVDDILLSTKNALLLGFTIAFSYFSKKS